MEDFYDRLPTLDSGPEKTNAPGNKVETAKAIDSLLDQVEAAHGKGDIGTARAARSEAHSLLEMKGPNMNPEDIIRLSKRNDELFELLEASER